MHVEQVLGDVPREERCTCRENKKEGRAPGLVDELRRLLLGS